MSEEPLALAVDGIKKQFGQVEVLKGVSVQAAKGDVIAILGASGSGKSTFLRCINLLETPNEGRITVAGEQIRLKPGKHGSLQPEDAKQLARIRSKLAMVFQSFNLWSHLTILENIIEAPVHVLKVPRKEAVEKAEHLLDKVGIHQRRNAYPSHISGGQQQRAAIARALAMEPTAMLFDEPTSALDPELVGEVLKVMRDLADEGRTMLVVTHEMGFARDVASEVVFLHQGRIEAQGAPQEMFGTPPTERFKQFVSGFTHQERGAAA
jgi:ABC-type histidine transport system ATPase subunit